ncbi:MAG: hypothetical protein A3E83_05940 [Gammaproteobacteria bacterium RIFCSPHIGHO2_12_FULL_41_20]|nr:MAG: hypothetical protein A3E83_05940 [Gammaproteobacteria bacterium RIFCSPHIGHO2_12_FULL_41_20]
MQSRPDVQSYAMSLSDILSFFPPEELNLAGNIAYGENHIQALLLIAAGSSAGFTAHKAIYGHAITDPKQVTDLVQTALQEAKTTGKHGVIPLYVGEGYMGHWVGIVISPDTRPRIYFVDDEKFSEFTRELKTFLEESLSQEKPDFIFRQYRQGHGTNNCGSLLVEMCTQLTTDPKYRYSDAIDPQQLRRRHQQLLEIALRQYSGQQQQPAADSAAGAAPPSAPSVAAAPSAVAPSAAPGPKPSNLEELRAARLRFLGQQPERPSAADSHTPSSQRPSPRGLHGASR